MSEFSRCFKFLEHSHPCSQQFTNSTNGSFYPVQGHWIKTEMEAHIHKNQYYVLRMKHTKNSIYLHAIHNKPKNKTILTVYIEFPQFLYLKGFSRLQNVPKLECYLSSKTQKDVDEWVSAPWMDFEGPVCQLPTIDLCCISSCSHHIWLLSSDSESWISQDSPGSIKSLVPVSARVLGEFGLSTIHHKLFFLS